MRSYLIEYWYLTKEDEIYDCRTIKVQGKSRCHALERAKFIAPHRNAKAFEIV